MAFQINKAQSRADFDNVFQLWRRNLPALSIDRLEWFYRKNPAGHSETVTASNDEGKVVGSGSYFIREIQIGDSSCFISIAADFSVDEEYRLFGPALGIQRRLVEVIGENKLLTGSIAFPNKSGMAVFKRVGYRSLSVAEFWSKPLTVKKIIAKRTGNRLIRSMLSGVADFGLGLYENVRRKRLPPGWAYKEIDHFNEKVDLLWTDNRGSYDITPARTSDFLNWRYFDNPVDDYRVIVIEDENSAVAGYVVYKEISGYLEIVDLFSRRQQFVYEALLSRVVEQGIKDNRSSVCLSFIGEQEFRDALKKMGFRYKSDVKRSLMVMFEDDAAIQTDRWFIFEGDMDL